MDPLLFFEIRRRPTLPGTLVPSTIGAGGLNFRVRNGYGCGPTAITTEIYWPLLKFCGAYCQEEFLKISIASTNKQQLHTLLKFLSSPRPISTGQLNTLLCLHFRPINVVFCHGPYPVNPVGYLILELASHLDAFSGYPFRRSLTSHAPGGTTGTRELRPSRSSRTKDSSLQVSCAHSR